MSRVLVLLATAVVGACVPGVAPSDGAPDRGPSEAPLVVDEPPPSDEGPLQLELDGQLIDPALIAQHLEGDGHAHRVGWSETEGRFAYCRDVLDRDCTECTLVARDGSSESIEAGPGCAEVTERGPLWARLDAEQSSPAAQRWSAGAEVVMVVETREPEQTNDGGVRPMLKLGARARGGGPPSWWLHVDPCEGCGLDQVCSGQAHLDAVSLSPDAVELVVLVHLRGNDGREQMRLERVSTRRLAETASIPPPPGAH